MGRMKYETLNGTPVRRADGLLITNDRIRIGGELMSGGVQTRRAKGSPAEVVTFCNGKAVKGIQPYWLLAQHTLFKAEEALAAEQAAIAAAETEAPKPKRTRRPTVKEMAAAVAVPA